LVRWRARSSVPRLAILIRPEQRRSQAHTDTEVDLLALCINFSGMAILRGGTCGTVDNNLTATTPDGSGYVLTTAVASIPPATVNTTANKVYVSPANATSGSGSGTDRNGNVITANTNGTFTDTLGTTALTVAGTAPSNTTFSYTAPSGASPAYAMSYKTYTVKTNFGCSVADCGPTSNSLVDRITLPDAGLFRGCNGKIGFCHSTNRRDHHVCLHGRKLRAHHLCRR